MTKIYIHCTKCRGQYNIEYNDDGKPDTSHIVFSGVCDYCTKKKEDNIKEFNEIKKKKHWWQ